MKKIENGKLKIEKSHQRLTSDFSIFNFQFSVAPAPRSGVIE
jgi:hypothetical protein